jgi:hypothetical protein
MGERIGAMPMQWNRLNNSKIGRFLPIIAVAKPIFLYTGGSQRCDSVKLLDISCVSDYYYL